MQQENVGLKLLEAKLIPPDALQKAQQQIEAAQAQAAAKGKANIRAVFSEAVAEAREQIKQVENTWNSIYRAGSQLFR